MQPSKPLPQFIRLIAWLGLLAAGPSKAAEYAETNNMPAAIHGLMETAGYIIPEPLRYNLTPDTNSLRNVAVMPDRSFGLQKSTRELKGWSLWDNSSIKYLKKSPILATPAYSQLEFDIYYPFKF